MKKLAYIMTAVVALGLMLTGMAFAFDIPNFNTSIGGNRGDNAGILFLFQKCDDTLKGTANHDSSGCPNIGTGPWPIFPNNGRWGELRYSLWGKDFDFAFRGRNLLPDTNYTLIYYPDPFPGNDLICLGSGQTNPAGNKQGKNRRRENKPPPGNIEIHGSMDIGTSLPAAYDANFNPITPSGAVGAKIWLVLSSDVQCTSPTRMVQWTPTEYLFEYNLIVYERLEFEED